MGKKRWVEILLILIALIVDTKGETLFISSTGSGTECTETAPCSLSYASQIQQPNDVFTFLTGTYFLNEVVSLNAENLTLISENNDFINTIITSTTNQVIFNITSENIKFQSLSFTNLSNTIAIYSIGSLLNIENCVFSNISSSTGHSAAIYTLKNAFIFSSSFENCSSKSVQYSDSISINGGVIYIGQSASIINTKFVNSFSFASYNSTTNFISSSINGGIVFIGENGMIINSTIMNSMILSEVNSVGFPATSTIYGGLIFIGQNGTINSSNFNNYSINGYNSATSISSQTNYSNTFVTGGSIYIGGVGLINNSSFNEYSVSSLSDLSGNSYLTGGTIFIGINGTIINTLFVNSSSSTQTQLNGGLIYIQLNGTLENLSIIQSVTSSSNNMNGGLIYMQLNGMLENLSIIQSTSSASKMNGGLINIQLNGYLENLLIIQSVSSASSVNGGTLFVGNIAEISDSKFTNCTSTFGNGIGGFIQSKDGIISNLTFINSYDSGSYTFGGTIAFTQSGLIINSIFKNTLINNDTIYGNLQGGVLYFGNGIVINSTFTDTSINILGRNSGGIIFFSQFGEIRNSSFTNISATNFTENANNANHYNGGVVYSGGNATVIDTIFQNLTTIGGSELIGGAVYISNNGSIIRSNIINSTVMTYYSVIGAGMFFGENGVINSSNFINISSGFTEVMNFGPKPGCRGGVIFSLDAIITNSTFINSHIDCQTKTVVYTSAASYCSAATLEIISDLLLIDSTFVSNSITSVAENSGVSLSIKGGLMAIGNASFQNVIINSTITSFTTVSSTSFAYLTGGVIYIDQGADFNNVSISNSIIDISPTFGTYSVLGALLYINEQLNCTNSVINNNSYDFSYQSNLLSCSTLYFTNSTLDNNHSYRIFLTDLAVVENSSIKSNTAASSIIDLSSSQSNITNCYFSGNVITSYQSDCFGVLMVQGGEISNSYFRKNQLVNCHNTAATAIYHASNNNLTISNTTFDGNSFSGSQFISAYLFVIYSQSFFSIDNLKFINHPNIQKSLIYFDIDTDYALISIRNTTFEKNYFSLSTSQFLSFSATEISVDYVLLNSNFIENGGTYSYSFLVSSSNNSIISNCNFISNKKLVLQSVDSNLVIFQSNFTSNQAPKSIVEIIGTSNSNITIENTNFISNIISSSNSSCNGILYIDSGISTISQCTFDSNQINCPTTYGGCLTVRSNVEEIYISPMTLFQNNSILGENSYGAAIYSEIALTLNQIQFLNNSLSGNTILEGLGVALYISLLDENNTQNITIYQCTFENNFIFSKSSQILATYSGGAIFINLNSRNANVIISESLFDGNSIISETSISVQTFPILRTISGSTIVIQSDGVNTQNVLQINSCNITGSLVNKGCPIYQIIGGVISSSIAIELNDCYLNDIEILTARNTKSITGGIVFSQISTSSKNSLFFNNTITPLQDDECQVQLLISNSFQGGVIYSEEANLSNCIFENTLIISNNAEGGVIWMEGGSIESSYFNSNLITSTNQASSSGGAIWSSTNNFIISNSSFANNIADFGGAIAINHFDSYPIFINVTITDNKANQNGGAIFIFKNSMNEILNCSALGTISKNEYRFGGECGSVSKSLDFYSKSIKEVFPSQSFSLELCLKDWFDQLVIDPFLSVTLLPSKYLSIGILNVYTLYSDNLGVYSFFSLSLYSPPGENNTLSFTSQIVEPNYNKDNIFSISTSILTGNCPATLVYQYSSSSQLSSCISCGISQYNLNGTGCYDCPSNSLHNSGSQCVELFSTGSNNLQSPYYSISNGSNIHYLKIEGGWWPNQFTNPDYLIPCPYDDACLPIYCILLPNITDLQWTLQCEDCNTHHNLSTVIDYYAQNAQFNESKYNDLKCDYCSEGYTDTFCSQCECNSIRDCYYLSDQQCIQCTVYSYSNLAMLLIGIVVLIVVIPIIVIIPKSTIFWILAGLIGVTLLAFAGLVTWYYSTLLFILLFCYFFVDKRFPEGLLKCLFYYLQIISSIVVLNAWPPAFRGLIQTFQIANLEISFLSCFWPKLLSDPLHLFILFNLIVPILVILLSLVLILEARISLVPFIKNLRRSVLMRFSVWGIFIDDNDQQNELSFNGNDINNGVDEDDDEDVGDVRSSLISPNENEIVENNNFIATFSIEKENMGSKIDQKRKTISKISKLILSISSAAYLPISLMSFSMLSCSNGYMDEYHWIPCSTSSSFIYFVSISIFVIISFVVTYPLILLIILLFYRSSNEFHYVFENYREGAYYYEFIFIVKKLTITILLTLFQSNSSYQQFLLTAILCIGIALLYQIRPFKSNSLNICSFASEIVICFSYVYNIIYLDLQLTGESMLLSSWVVMALNIIIILLFLYLLIQNHSFIRRFSCSPKKYSYL